MDKFLLQNVARYQELIRAFDPKSAPRTGTITAGATSPDMVVSARIRPLLKKDIVAGWPGAIFPRSDEEGVLDIHDLYNHPRGRPILKSFNYQVDRLFQPDSTTDEIYENVVVDLVPFAWEGGIGTLFAYGQTGSGKTFTTSRLQQLVCGTLLEGDLLGSREIYITIIDLAGNLAFDLLNSRAPIAIQEDSLGVTQLTGVREHLVESGDEMMTLIERAASFRRTAPTAKNDASSRSHGICRIRINNPLTNSHGLLYLVDLAGSEAARDVAVHGADRMRETREINMSLSVLKDCIRGKVQADALKFSGGPKSKQKKPPHIPFRQSALTKILKHIFDPNGKRACKTVVIACVNPSLADVGPSKNTLRYAEMLRVVVPSTKNTSASGAAGELVSGLSSIDSSVAGVPFKERIRPGMIVSWKESSVGRSDLNMPTISKLAAILCPVVPLEEVVNDDLSESEYHGTSAKGSKVCARYLCAHVMPGKEPESHELSLWQQTVVDVDSMDKEIILRYDPETRYYFVVETKVE